MFEPQTYVLEPAAEKFGMLPPDNNGRTPGVDWERGAPQGAVDLTIRNATWKSRVNGGGGVVEVTSDLVTWVPVGTFPTINFYDFSFSFDLNMNPMIGYTEVGVPNAVKLYWFDGTIPGYTTISITGSSPFLTFDYPVDASLYGAEALIFYVVSGSIKYRRQSDRFTIEYTFGAMPAGLSKITGAGMGRNWRLHLRLGR